MTPRRRLKAWVETVQARVKTLLRRGILGGGLVVMVAVGMV